MKYFGVTFLVILAGLYLVIVGITGRTAIALACIVDPHDVEDGEAPDGSRPADS